MKRPLIPVALCYMLGILLGNTLALPLEFLLPSGLLFVVTGVLFSRMRPIFILLACVLAGWTGEVLHTAVISPNDLRTTLGNGPEIITLHGRLRETPTHRFFVQDQKESWRTLCQLQVTEARVNRHDWQPAVGRVAVLTPALLTNYFAGQIVEITGVAHLPKNAVAEGLFNYRVYLKQNGIYYQLDAGSEEDWRIISSPENPPLADRFRAWAREALAAGIPKEDDALRLEWALALGWKAALTEEVSEPFVRAATYHIFAVDGLRMAIIFGIFFTLLRALNISRAVCGLLLIPIIWFYTGLTGWPASAVRASVMLTIVIAGWVLKRPGDLINSLFAAAIIILVWQPQQLFQPGFQLSFLVVLCIVMAMPIFHNAWQCLWRPDPLLPQSLYPRYRRIFAAPGRFAGDVFLTSLAAWVGSIPLVAYYFHIVTPISTPANVLAVPLCGLVLISNLSSLLLMGWFPQAGILFNHAGWFFMECIRVSSDWFARWPAAAFYVSEPGLFTITLYYAILLAALGGLLFKPRVRLLIGSAAAGAVCIWFWQFCSYANATRLHILPANGAMAIFVDRPGWKQDVLIDCGASNAVSMIVKPFLRAQGVNHLAGLALTHGDIHHVGGARLLSDLFAPEHVWVSPVRFRSTAYRRIVSDFDKAPGKLQRVSRNQTMGSWKVLHPDADDKFAQADDNALVLFETIEGTRLLLVSDLGRQGQSVLLERSPELRADIVITGLPSRSEPVSDAFLEAVQPRLIIVVDSEFPISERTNPKSMTRLRKTGIPVIFTRSAGSTTIEWHRHHWMLRTASGLKMDSETLPPAKPLVRHEPLEEG